MYKWFVCDTNMYTECTSPFIPVTSQKTYGQNSRTFPSQSIIPISLLRFQSGLWMTPQKRLKESTLTMMESQSAAAARHKPLHPLLHSELWFIIIQWAHIHIKQHSGVSSKEVMFNFGVLYLLLKKERETVWYSQASLGESQDHIPYILTCFKKQKVCPRVKGLTFSYSALRAQPQPLTTS